MAELGFLLQYAGIPFVSDRSQKIEPFGRSPTACSLVDEINKRLPLQYLQDFAASHSYPGRTTDGLAAVTPAGLYPTPLVRINDWYYPNTAKRWSVFRGLATSAMVKAMLEATGGGAQFKPFIIKSCPISPDNPGGIEANYTITTNLRMLPPRPIGELGGDAIGGLYLVTLVDERYDWQHKPATLRVTQNTSWSSLFTSLASTLGITLTYNPGIEAAAFAPEPDSQLWANSESAASLLDALAYNVGCCIVRNYDGTYVVMDPLASRTIAETNRGTVTSVARLAGGDLFASGGKLAVGNLSTMRNAVVPANIVVTFPKYIVGNDPVPHFLNPRQSLTQPSTWQEDSYGEMYSVTVPVQSGTCYSGSRFSGISGVGSQYIHTTAKAFYSGEIQAASNPLNNSGLTSLAMFMAKDHYDSQAAVAFDEAYPGTFAWTPEGVHDLVYTYSDSHSMAAVRVMRTEWNTAVLDTQHRTPVNSGSTSDLVGAGGQSVAQTWQGGWSGNVVTAVSGNLASGGYSVLLASGGDNLPTDRRWKGLIGTERVLFEGTSGGLTVTVVKRGIDGTVQSPQSGAVVSMVTPQDTYGVNFVRFGTGQRVLPGEWTSGGVLGVDVIPQLQSVYVHSASGVTIKGNTLYSGRVNYVEPSVSGSHYVNGPLCWVWERNGEAVYSGKRYGGQFIGWTASGPCAPVYGINGFVASGGGTPTITSGSVGSGALGNGAVVSGSVSSGALGYYHLSALLQAYLDSCCCDVFVVTTSGDYVITTSGEYVTTTDPLCENIPSSGSVNSGALASGLLTNFIAGVNVRNSGGGYSVSGIKTLTFEDYTGVTISGNASGEINVYNLPAGLNQAGIVTSGTQIFPRGDKEFYDSIVSRPGGTSGARLAQYAASTNLYRMDLTDTGNSDGSRLQIQNPSSGVSGRALLSFIGGTGNASGLPRLAVETLVPGAEPAQIGQHFMSGPAFVAPYRVAGGLIVSGQELTDPNADCAVGWRDASGRTDWIGFSGGLITSTNLSGRVQVGIGSGQVSSGMLANGTVVSGSVASGQIGTNHLASGAAITVNTTVWNYSQLPYTSGIYSGVQQYVLVGYLGSGYILDSAALIVTSDFTNVASLTAAMGISGLGNNIIGTPVSLVTSGQQRTIVMSEPYVNPGLNGAVTVLIDSADTLSGLTQGTLGVWWRSAKLPGL